jgi:hypothetical protein
VAASAISAVPTEPKSFLDRGGALLRAMQLLVRGALEFGAARIEAGNVLGRRQRRLTLGQQEVAAIARLHLHPIADVAEVGHFLQQDQFHARAL